MLLDACGFDIYLGNGFHSKGVPTTIGLFLLDFLGCQSFTSPTIDINYRTLWIFINSAFEDDFGPYRAAHLLREIFQICYARLTDLIASILESTPDDYIKVEV